MSQSMNALDLLRRDHRHVQELLKKFEKTEAENEQRELCDQIVDEIRTHTELEERVFYPYLRDATAREDLFQKATIEHETAKDLLDKLPREQAGTPRFKAMVEVLGDYIEHHLKEEEGEIFPQVEKSGVDLQALGQALQDAREGKDPMQPPKAKGGNGGKAQKAEKADKGKADKGSQAHAGAGSAQDDEEFLREHEDELSRSTVHAKWIHQPGEGADRDGQTLATRNLEVIRAWADARKATPATTPGGDTERPHVLRFDFTGDDKLQPVSWEAWGKVFAERDLVFLFQDKLKSGKQSNFFRLDNPHREEA